jgi:hypothetical protein
MACRKTYHDILILMIYIIGLILIWGFISVLFIKPLFFSEQERQELPLDGLMGIAHDVFQMEMELEDRDDTVGSVLSEDDFEVEYDSIDIGVNDFMADDGNGEDSITQEGSIIGFKEMQQMVAVVEDDKPLSDLDNKSLENVKRTIKQVEDTDFFGKLIKTKEDISRRIDDILNNIN